MSKKDLSLKLQNPFRDYVKEFFSADKFKNSIDITAKNLPREKKEYQVVFCGYDKFNQLNFLKNKIKEKQLSDYFTFFDYLEDDWIKNFKFIRDVCITFQSIFNLIISQ